MESDFVVWASLEMEHGCFLTRLEGVQRRSDLTKGVPRQRGFPAAASMRMDRNTPADNLLFDFVDNVNRFIVISPTLAEFIKEQNVSHLEFLPFRLIDHSGSVSTTEYRILHPVNPVTCLDVEASAAEWSSVDRDTINSVDKLTIRESAIPKTRRLLRPKHFYQIVLVRRSLAERISSQRFTNIRWTELDDYEA